MATNGYKPEFTDKTFQDETIESVPTSDYREPKPTTFGQRLKNHFRRFWWLHLILFVGGFVIILLILLFVGFPNIAQSQIDAAKFELLEQQVWNPTPEQVYLRMVTLTTSKSQYHPRLDAFNTSLFLENTEPDIIPFGYIQSPETQVLSKTHITIDQTLTIANMDQFIAYNKMVFTSETYRVGVRGRTSLHEGSFPTTTVNFNKVVTSKGLNSLKGFKVANFSISVSPDADGSNLKGFVYIPNPSPMTLTFGTVVQDTYVDGQKIGNTTVDNMVLAPGDNYLPMRGSSDQGAVISLISTKYKDGILPITVVGNSVVYNGKHIPYYEEALKTSNLTASLDVGSALKAVGLGGLLPGASSSSAPAFPASTGKP